MLVVVNALSATNLSGPSVLLGHLAQLAEWTKGEHRYLVLYHRGNRNICRDLGPNVEWRECSGFTVNWLGRTLWERTVLPRLLRRLKADLLFMSSGTAVNGCVVPQAVLAMNPWCFVPRAQRNTGERIKAFLQRRAYRQAVRNAAMMVYISKYLRHCYQGNAGLEEKAYTIAYPALGEDLVRARDAESVDRQPHHIVSVSMMAPHKGVETVVEAVAVLRNDRGIGAELVLVGSWPDKRYENTIHKLVREKGLTQYVRFEGHVSRDDLFDHYASARVFCLMSWCESFGIPAVEAQAFGTPVVSSNCCAIPEVCGAGGIYPEPGDVEGTADALARLLTDDNAWKQLSAKAVENAERYRCDVVTRSLMKMFDIAEGR